jgi:hypothetical protein
MPEPHDLTTLLEQSGMPDVEWWAHAKATYSDLCLLLTEDINNQQESNSASRPRISIFPVRSFACELSSRHDILSSIAFGTIRKGLFVEVAWQNITGAQNRGRAIKTFEVSEDRILLDVDGFLFGLRYIESSEVVRQ